MRASVVRWIDTSGWNWKSRDDIEEMNRIIKEEARETLERKRRKEDLERAEGATSEVN